MVQMAIGNGMRIQTLCPTIPPSAMDDTAGTAYYIWAATTLVYIMSVPSLRWPPQPIWMPKGDWIDKVLLLGAQQAH